jgi:hypothetical protein
MDKSKRAGGKTAAKFAWGRDRIHNISTVLSSANSLWDAQTFGIPTDERTLEIVEKLDEAADLIETLRAELLDTCEVEGA